MYKKICCITAILWLGLLAGCSAQEPDNAEITLSPVPTQALKAEEVSMPSAASDTPTPEAISTPTATLGPTSMPTPTPTPTPIPVKAQYKLEEGVLVFYEGNYVDMNLTEKVLEECGLHRTEVESVRIEEGITEVRESAFDGWITLSEVSFPESLQMIGKRAFAGCEIATLEIPDSVTLIEDGAFADCSDLTSVILSANLQTIEEETFASCNQLKYLEIPDGVTIIRDRAFVDGCYDSPVFKIPDSVSYIDMDAFEGNAFAIIDCKQDSYAELYAMATGLEYTSGRENEIIMEYDNVSDTLTFRGNGVLTKDVVYDAWREYKIAKMTTIVIEEGILGIGPNAFDFDGWQYADIVLPESLQMVGAEAFRGCNGILSKEFRLPKNLKIIGAEAFYNCDLMTKVEISEGLLGIGKVAFGNCDRLEAIRLPDSLQEISEWAFDEVERRVVLQCNPGTYAQEYAIENQIACVKSIPDEFITTYYSFEGNTLTFSLIGSLCKYMVDDAVKKCNIVDEKIRVVLQEGIVQLDRGAFADLSNMVSIDIPDSVNSIKHGVFVRCSSLEEIQLPEHISVLSVEMFEDCTGLTSFAMSDNVTQIGEGSFGGCTNLKEIYVSKNLQRIDRDAFKECKSLKDIYLPESITFIYPTAFEDCENLVIHCKEDSEAHTFAKYNDIDYVLE